MRSDIAAPAKALGHAHISERKSPSPAPRGGEGRGEVGGAAPLLATARPTSPSHVLRRGPLPLLPQAGGEGKGASASAAQKCVHARAGKRWPGRPLREEMAL